MGTDTDLTDLDLSGLEAEMDVAGRKPRNPCDVERALDAIPEDKRDDLLGYVTDPSLNASLLSRKLRDRGIYIGNQTIRRHQKQECARCHYYDRF